ncbi:MAG TPA: flagellar biosynthetic protein FliQ [Bdellovibrionales bacterium]|nr:MAG: EscS/YscS/HrcS family type III secretion system export apparatus protein [Bdellovibrionales bacterium GWB1_52_6]OFZ04800.1 MAG: EscS/YscS/HrcS family type III secretion system export apparatus protein [Bdellovibrionales bacterium GWA1_52_35]OFZ42808.1 MAG: EscS/YscS/HrcS family type III secretion system export apparatus protein [Bdellovibrionales bacterium GWC1_52_8]HAR41905.1 flagellar biosynthetic protein FliQ [Bdellovibrionales bacterium]HCM39620.1 flagellar biosynthetic protein FliQ
MSEEMVMTLGSEAIKTMMMLAGPLLLAAMVIGMLVSLLQAITQINEATLTFIPKMIAVILVLVVMAPWMLDMIQQYTIQVLGSAGELVR